jgi:hypothetical protein
MCSPIVVRSSSSESATRQRTATTTATIVILRMSTPETVTGWLSDESDDAIFPSGPNQSSATLCSRNATAEDEPVHQDREHEHRGEAERDPRPHRPAPLRGEGQRERTRHHELAVGEVDKPQHAEDEADADGHKCIDGAEGDRVGERLPVDVEECEGHEK